MAALSASGGPTIRRVSRNIVFIHGAWVTPLCWERMQPWFQERGYETSAPAWPGKDRPIEEVRRDPSPLAGLGFGEIVDHYAAIVRGMPEPPILIGHSFGGLVVQCLLDRGLGAAGVAIDPAPPKGVFALEPTTLRALGWALFVPFGWRKVLRWSFKGFRYGFVHLLPPDEQRAAFDRHVVPETGRIFFQGAVAPLSRKSPMKVDFAKADRAPLLLIAGDQDHVVPVRVVRRTHKRYGRSPARTDLREFTNRTHWILAMDGWEDVAGSIGDWLDEVTPRQD